MRRIALALMLALIAPLALAHTALAQTTRTYSYDALGRLIKVTPGSGTPVCYTHDAADNRTTVSATAGCTVSPGTVTGGGGGANQAPTAVADYFAVELWTHPTTVDLDVLANDTDPNLPGDMLTIVSLTGTGSSICSIVASGTLIRCTTSVSGSKHWTYLIQDAGGLTSSAALDVDLIDCTTGGC